VSHELEGDGVAWWWREGIEEREKNN